MFKYYLFVCVSVQLILDEQEIYYSLVFVYCYACI